MAASALFLAGAGLSLSRSGDELLISAAIKKPYLYSQFSPKVVYFLDGDSGVSTMFGDADTTTSSTRMEVAVRPEVNVQQVRVQVMENCGAKREWRQMNDQGVDGDQVADDDIWTYDGLTSCTRRNSYVQGNIKGIHFSVEIKTAGSRGRAKKQTFTSGRLGVVKERHAGKFKAENLGPNSWATKYAMFFREGDQTLLCEQPMPLCEVVCGRTNNRAFHQVYKYYPDKFDFLVVFPAGTTYDPDRDYGTNVPYFIPVRNRVRNIGEQILNNSADFGSDGRLLGVIYHSFGEGGVMDHEIMHAWGVDWDEDLEHLGITFESHWERYTNIEGQLGGGLKLEDNGDGTYRVERLWRVSPFEIPSDTEGELNAPIELYLMGLLKPSKVPDVWVLRNREQSDWDRVPESEFDIYTIEQIMEIWGGQRSPRKGKKKYTIGYVVVSDQEFSQAEFDYFSLAAKNFSSRQDSFGHHFTPFHQQTHGLASMRSKLPKPS
jgi:hypothetical protein